MTPMLIAFAAFVGVSALCFGLYTALRGGHEAEIEDRLDIFTGAKSATLAGGNMDAGSVLSEPLDEAQDVMARFFARFGNLQILFRQADVKLTPSRFFALTAIFASVGGIISVASGIHAGAAPVSAAFSGTFPLLYVLFRRRKRLKRFGAQLPDALDLMSRSLRAGHSLPSGFSLVASEMKDPISTEFGAVFEEQNLGISIEEALEGLSDRIPNMDLRFFATALILQRQTGGDLAEILDKISHLIRERFRIYGQVQALTGEGRLSGAVLLAMPPLLGLVVYYLNPSYVMLLFTDPMGQRLLVIAVIMQLIGAVVIRKIINIKV